MDRSAAWQQIRSRRGLAAIVCLALVVGGIAVVGGGPDIAMVDGGDVPGSDQLPAWGAVYPSLELDETETEQLVHENINDAREERELEPLSRDETLSQVARNHSQDMADRGYFDHTTPEGIEPETRVDRAGVACTDVSENIVRLSRSNHEVPLAEDVVTAWLDSAGHLINIVGNDWSRTGVGVVAGDDSVYVTQVFCA